MGRKFKLEETISMSDRDHIIYDISQLASSGYQERIWLNGIGPEVDDFNEHLLKYYSFTTQAEERDLKLLDIDELKKYFTVDDIKVLEFFQIILGKFIEQYGWDLSHKELLKNKDWINVQNEAKKVCEYFDVEIAE